MFPDLATEEEHLQFQVTEWLGTALGLILLFVHSRFLSVVHCVFWLPDNQIIRQDLDLFQDTYWSY